ncbi:MAG: hypothetical protein KDA33_17410, partial [Phycisphaerales bacterium]|nr:hypothetical protein [Phycisphaerales bacterium]
MAIQKPVHRILIASFATFIALVPLSRVLADDSDDDKGSRRKEVDMSEVPQNIRDELVNLRFVTKVIGEGFKVRRSLHYSIIYNTSEEDVEVFEYAIEKTYRACVKWSRSLGMEVHPPKQKMLTHFFNDYTEYARYGAAIGNPPKGPGNVGFFFFPTEYSYFYNVRNTPGFKNRRLNIESQITQLADMLKRG